jgi:prophage regulatory protein
MVTEEPRLIRLPEVQRLTGLGRSQTYALARAGKFPTPIKISERCSAWDERAVRAWIADRIAAASANAE